MRPMHLRLLTVLAACSLFPRPVLSTPTLRGPLGSLQEIEYGVREVMIPMRDGVKLYTQVFEPVAPQQDLAILFRRTPYGVDPAPSTIDPALLGPSPEFAGRPYAYVLQDARGQFRSEGEWELLRPLRSDPTDPGATDESTDAWDTIDWLLENVEGNNGRVGMWGISYDAWQTVMAMADAHPALVAASPQASPGDWFLGDDAHHFGAFRLNYMFVWIAYMAVRRGDASPQAIGPVFGKDAYEFFLDAGSLQDISRDYLGEGVPEWADMLAHGNYDEYWKQRDPLQHLSAVRPAVLHVAGWFDAEDFRGPLDIYSTIESTPSAERNSLVIGPWQHGGWSTQVGDGSSFGDLDFGEATATRFQEDVEFLFFEHHLHGAADPELPEAFVFETGGNAWHELDQWPPADIQWKELFLQPGGAASFTAPTQDEGHTAFMSDPGWPVPYTESSAVVPDAEYMIEDQRFLSEREDVLSFLTEPLEEDLVLAGAPEVRLRVSTTGTDADWVVKLIDVYPEETAATSAKSGDTLAESWLLLTGDVFRAKYRESFEQPTALVPDEVTELVFPLPDRLHRFRAGHRILVQVHSTWFPLYDRNPQEFMDIYAASEEDFQVHEHRVLHDADAASCVRLPLRRP